MICGITIKAAKKIIKYLYFIKRGEVYMDKYACLLCGYKYDAEIGDPHGGIAPGTKFEDRKSVV